MKKVLKVLPLDEKKYLIIFFGLLIIIMILESLSIGAIFPLILTILSDNFETERTYLAIQNYTGNLSYKGLIFLLLTSISLIFVLKNLFIIYFKWWSHGFINRVQFKIQRKLLEIYLHQSYLDVLSKNTAIKVRNIASETSRFAKYLMSLMQLIIESMVVLVIGLLLFVLNPKVAIFVIVLISILTLSFYLVAKIKAVNWSKKKIFHDGFSMKFLIESLSSIKELKIFNKESLFLDRYSFQEKNKLHFSRLFSTFNESPRILIEAFMIVTICISIIFMTKIGVEKKEILATLGIFAVAGFRLFPSTTSIIRAVNEVKSNLPSINLIIDELNLEKNIQDRKIKMKDDVEFNNSIKLTNVNFCYPNKKQNIVSDVNLEIKKGSRIVVRGDSGSGKSTLLNLIMGFLKPTKGEIKIDGINIHENYNDVKNLFSYVSQETFLLDETIRYNITFKNTLDPSNEKKLYDILNDVNLKSMVDQLDKGLDTVVGEKGFNISGGQRQRISIARAIYAGKQILILDEPTNELDEVNELSIVKNIINKQKNQTIILSTHNKELIKFCEIELILENGRINQKINDEQSI